MLVSKIVCPQDRLKRGLKQAIKALLGAVARQKTRVPRVANRSLFDPPLPRRCPLLKLELSFICRAEKNLLQERKKICKSTVQPRLCSTTHGIPGVDLFFFLVATMFASSIFTWWPPKTKQKKRSTPDYPPGQEQRVSN